MSDRIAVFDHGRIAQVGSPAEIYEHPHTAFVAGFVGTSTVLTGPAAVDLLGRDGTFAVRPERVRLSRADRTNGTIAEVVYLGASTHSIVDLDAGPALTVSHQNADRTIDAALERRQQRVVLSWRRDHLVALAGSAPVPADPPLQEETP